MAWENKGFRVVEEGFCTEINRRTVPQIEKENNMEYWDLYDAERKPLGRTHARGEKFREGEYYVCCEIWVRNKEGSFLTTKRHPDKTAGNKWEFVGGGTLAGETTLDSAVRELFEETGIVIDKSELRLFTTDAKKNYFLDIYLVKKDVDIKDVILQPEETTDAKWSSDEDIKDMVASGEFAYSVGVRYGKYRELCWEV